MTSPVLRMLRVWKPKRGAELNPEPVQRVNIAAPEFRHFPLFPEGFRPGIARLGNLLGAAMTGMSVYELPPGQAIGPYHHENPEEEWLLVLDGRPTLRHTDGEDELKPWDVVLFPPGPTRRLRVALLWLTGRQERLGQRSAMSPERSALSKRRPCRKQLPVPAFGPGPPSTAAEARLPLGGHCRSLRLVPRRSKS